MNLPLPSGFVSGGESAAQDEYVACVDAALHLGYRARDVIGREVAEDACRNLGAGTAESPGRIVVAVGSGEHRQIGHRVLDGRTLVFGHAGLVLGIDLHRGMVAALVG